MKIQKYMLWCIIAWLASIQLLQAQQITQIEYWIGDDYGNAVIENINVSADSITIDIPYLFNSNDNEFGDLIYCRFKDDQGKWSTVYSQPMVMKNNENVSTVKLVEYWYDDDFANRVLMPLTDNIVGGALIGQLIDIDALSFPAEKISYRFKGVGNQWSEITTMLLKNLPTEAQYLRFDKIEYWFDNEDFDQRKTIALNNQPDANPIDMILYNDDIDWNDGAAIVYYRLVNEATHEETMVHSYNTHAIPDDNNSITKVEYWYNNDFNNRQTKMVTMFEPLYIDIEEFTPQLNTDTILNIRYLDNLGNWSVILSNHIRDLEINPVTAVDPEVYDFGDVIITETLQQQFTLTNNGTTTITITDFILNGTNSMEFSHDGVNNTEVAPNGGTYQFMVTFAPTTLGDKTTNLIIENDTITNAIVLSGKGVLPPPTVVVDNQCGQSVLTANDYIGDLTWSTGEGTASITVNMAGTYSVTQTVNGITSSPAIVMVSPKEIPDAPMVTVDNQIGKSVLTASNYSGTLSWSTGESTASITVTQAGIYTITQTVDGCVSPEGSGLAEPASPPVPVIMVSNECGQSVLTASNYSGTLSWSTGESTTSITVNMAGTYSVTQTINGVTSSPAIAIASPKEIPDAPMVTVDNQIGQSILTASNYSGTLSWNTGESTASITVMVAGTYSVTQTVDGCTSVEASAVAAPNTPGLIQVTVDDLCGYSVLTASNYSGTLSWSTGESTASITVNISGTYSVTQ